MIADAAASTTTSTAEIGALSLSLTAGAAEASGAATAGVGAAIVLFLSFLLGSIASSSQADSSLAKALQQIQTEVSDIEVTALASYWNDQLDSGFHSYWNPPGGGGLQTDFDDLAAQGTGENHVEGRGQLPRQCERVRRQSRSLGGRWSGQPHPAGGLGRLLQRPDLQELRFSPYSKIAYRTLYPYGDEGLTNIPPNAPQTSPPFTQMWYGKICRRPRASLTPRASPRSRTRAPSALYPDALCSESSHPACSRASSISSTPSSPRSASSCRSTTALYRYADFVYSLYSQSVHGIVKTDMPSDEDALGYLTFYIFQLGHNAGKLGAPSRRGAAHHQRPAIGPVSMPQFGVTGGTGPDAYTALPTAGTQWNGVYGVANEYPPTARISTQPSAWGKTLSPGMAAPSYIIDVSTPMG